MRLRALSILAIGLAALPLWQRTAEACSFDCETRPHELYIPTDTVPTAGFIQVHPKVLWWQHDGTPRPTPEGGWCESEIDIVVLDGAGAEVAGELRQGRWRSAEPLTAGARYVVELYDGDVVQERRSVVAEDVDTRAPVPESLALSGHEVGYNCAWSCCDAETKYESRPRRPSFDGHDRDTDYLNCGGYDAGCMWTCHEFCGVTARAYVPRLELQWRVEGDARDAVLEYELRRGGSGGDLVGTLAPWDRALRAGEVVEGEPDDDALRTMSVEGFMPGQPLCLTLTVHNLIDGARSPATTLCLDSNALERATATLPDVGTKMESACRDETPTQHQTASEVLKAWCPPPTPFDLPPPVADDLGGADASPDVATDTAADALSETDTARPTRTPADDERGCGCRMSSPVEHSGRGGPAALVLALLTVGVWWRRACRRRGRWA